MLATDDLGVPWSNMWSTWGPEHLGFLKGALCESQVCTSLGTVLRGCCIGRKLCFLAVFFQKPEMRRSSECQSCRRTGNKNWRWEWLSGTLLLCELSLTLAQELPPRSACSWNTVCWICVSGLGKLSEDRAGFPGHWDKDSSGPCRTFPLAGMGVIFMVLSIFPCPAWLRENLY